MIPSEVAAIASLICPQWTETDDLVLNEVLEAARRIYNAGYRRLPQETPHLLDLRGLYKDGGPMMGDEPSPQEQQHG